MEQTRALPRALGRYILLSVAASEVKSRREGHEASTTRGEYTMSEQVEGPLFVSGDNGTRHTYVSGTSLLLGRRTPEGQTTPEGTSGGSIRDLLEGDMVATHGNTNVVLETTNHPAVLLKVGDEGASGVITVRDEEDGAIISLDGRAGHVSVGAMHGRPGLLSILSGKNGPVIKVNGATGCIEFRDDQLRKTLVIDGTRGDIDLIGADCAEDFDVASPVEAGSVVCVDDEGALSSCVRAYDRRVVGVISGAGDWHPALRLDRQCTERPRAPLALVGKVYGLADASHAPIRVGDLLTTSTTPGHAMLASDATQAFGAVLGKSLKPLRSGQGLVPMLIALQ